MSSTVVTTTARWESSPWKIEARCSTRCFLRRDKSIFARCFHSWTKCSSPPRTSSSRFSTWEWCRSSTPSSCRTPAFSMEANCSLESTPICRHYTAEPLADPFRSMTWLKSFLHWKRSWSSATPGLTFRSSSTQVFTTRWYVPILKGFCTRLNVFTLTNLFTSLMRDASPPLVEEGDVLLLFWCFPWTFLKFRVLSRVLWNLRKCSGLYWSLHLRREDLDSSQSTDPVKCNRISPEQISISGNNRKNPISKWKYLRRPATWIISYECAMTTKTKPFRQINSPR